MLKYIEVTGKNEEEAIAKGLAQLGLDRDDVSLEILERGRTGFLGIGSVPAKVKLTYEVPDEPEQPPVPQPPVEEKKPEPKPAPRPEPSPRPRPKSEPKPQPRPEPKAKSEPAPAPKSESLRDKSADDDVARPS